MRAPLEVRLERFEKLLDQISDESERGSVIVVEGTRDRESLRKMGIVGPILCLQNSRMNTLGFAEGLQAKRKVVVLTDFDHEGVSLARRLLRILNSQRIHANLILWRELRRLTKWDIRSIEELPKFYERLQSKNPMSLRLDLGYEHPVLKNGRRIVDYRRLRLSRQHKYVRKTRRLQADIAR